MALIDLANYLGNPATGTPFVKRIAAAIAGAAVAVRNEPDSTPNHADRLIWADQVLLDPEPMAFRMRWAVASNPAIGAAIAGNTAIPDGDIEFTVATLIDAFAR